MKIAKLASEDDLGQRLVSQRVRDSSQRESSAEPSVAEILPAMNDKKSSIMTLDYGNRPSMENLKTLN